VSIDKSGAKWADRTRKVVEELDREVPGLSWGTYPGHDPSESLAADGMCGRALGDKVTKIVADVGFCRPRRVWYVIHWEKIWSMTRPERGWLPYYATKAKGYTDSQSHRNHVHLSMYASGEVTTPPTAVPDDGPPDFPGADTFRMFQGSDFVTQLDRRLIAHGSAEHFTGDAYQPGPVFTENTLLNVYDFQRAQGWTGTDADGYPGAETWRRLWLNP
jgi:hypothetical protein